MRILFLGGPGSGKSTQGQILAEDKGLRWISSGELCRNSGDPEILEIIKGSKLIPDELMGKMVIEEIRKGDIDHFILDGFPRNEKQCEILENAGVGVDFVLEISVSEEEVLNRLKLRGREQDDEGVVIERIRMYERTRDETLDHFRRKGVKIVVVDGNGKIEEIAKKIKEVIV